MRGYNDTMKYNLGTPFIVDTSIDGIEDYIESLSPYGKRHLRRGYRDYNAYKFIERQFSPAIYGESRPTRPQGEITTIKQSSVECMLRYLNRRDAFKMFVATDKLDSVAGYIFLEMYGNNYATASCPINRLDGKHRYFSYYMWRNIIEHCIGTDIKWLNLGESKSWTRSFRQQPTWSQPTWRRMLLDTEDLEWTSSFSLLLPKHIKESPDQQPNYIMVHCKQCDIGMLHNIDSNGFVCVCTCCNMHHIIDNKQVLI